MVVGIQRDKVESKCLVLFVFCFGEPLSSREAQSGRELLSLSAGIIGMQSTPNYFKVLMALSSMTHLFHI